MIIYLNHLVHGLSFLLIVIFSDIYSLDVAVIAMCMLVSWSVSYYGLHLVGTDRSAEIGAVAIGIIIFFWVAYVTKMGLVSFLFDQFWVVPLLISGDDLKAQMPNAFVIATVGFLSLMVGVLTFPLRADLRWQTPIFQPDIRVLSYMVPVALIVKYILKIQFNLGIPGVDPVYLGIPYAAGLLTFVIDTGYIFLSNILLFCGLVLGRPRLMIFGLLLGFTNAVMDLKFGSKDTLMFQLAITASYIFIARYSLAANAVSLKRTLKISIIVLSVFGIATIMGYKFFNEYRFVLFSGEYETALSAIKHIAVNDARSTDSSIIRIYNRITGLETLTAVINLRGALSVDFSFIGMIDGSIVKSFSYLILGTTEAKTAFSITRFGDFYLSGGLVGLVVACFLLGFFFCIAQYFVLRRNVNHAMILAFLPVLWILFIHSLLGGGDLTLWLKQLLVLILCFYFGARIACPNHRIRLSFY